MVLSPMAWARLLHKKPDGLKAQNKRARSISKRDKSEQRNWKARKRRRRHFECFENILRLVQNKDQLCLSWIKIPGAVNYLSAHWNSSYCCYSTMTWQILPLRCQGFRYHQIPFFWLRAYFPKILFPEKYHANIGRKHFSNFCMHFGPLHISRKS